MAQGGRNALSGESCAKTFGGRTGLSTLSNNFRQFSLWGTAKSRLGPMKKPEAVRLEQAPSAVSRLFRNRCAILGLLRRPTPDSLALFTKHGCSPRDRNDGVSRQWCFSTIAAIWKMLDQACLNPALFHLRRISGARYNSSPIQLTGGNCLKVYTTRFARMESRGVKPLWRRFGRAERPTSPSPRLFLFV